MKKLSILKALLISGTVLSAMPALAGDSVDSIIKDGKFFGEIRYRYETVEQDGTFTNDNEATANTIRTNLGFETGEYQGFQALIEAQIIQHLGDDDFNSTTNGNAGAFPIIADPDVAELNELWLSYAGVDDTVVKVGRQKVNIDNQRFVGTVGWRQNDQTFDAAALLNSSIPNLDLMYARVANVNRIQGGDHALGDLDTETHIAHANYKVADWLNVAGYGYWLDIDLAPSLSSKTYGLRLTGDAPINEDWTFFYEAEVATQDDHGNNTSSYDETYYHIAPGMKGHGFTLKAGYEELGGDGTNAFQTPLATGHKFNGWADAFLTTPDEGLTDTYIGASYKVSGTDSVLDGTKFAATYHDFDSDAAAVGDFGDEIDLSVGKTFTLKDAGHPFKNVNVLLKYADYDGETAAGVDADREKFWLQVGVKF